MLGNFVEKRCKYPTKQGQTARKSVQIVNYGNVKLFYIQLFNINESYAF